jgi:hypothetical protein
MLQRVRRKRPVTDSGFAASAPRPCPARHHGRRACRRRAEVDDVVGAADRVLVVLDDDQRVALGAELLQRVEQDLVVARMQADGRLVEDVADAAQVRAELRREPDALRLAARERRRARGRASGSPGRPPRGSSRRERSRRRCRARSRLRGRQLRAAARPSARIATDSARCRRSTAARSARRAPRVQARCRRRSGRLVDSSHRPTGRARGRGPVVVVALVVVQPCAARELEAGAVAGGHQPCLLLYENRRGSSSGSCVPHDRAGALGREHLDLPPMPRACRISRDASQAVQRRQHVHTPLPMSSALASSSRSSASFSGADDEVATGSSIVCSLKRSRRGQPSVGRSRRRRAGACSPPRPLRRGRCRRPCG